MRCLVIITYNLYVENKIKITIWWIRYILFRI